MSHVRWHIAVAKGRYCRAATKASVRDALQWVFADSLCKLEFMDPDTDDIAVEGEVVVALKSRFRRWGHDEVVRDRIVMALVNRLKPEYESQVEVEASDGPNESIDWDDFEG